MENQGEQIYTLLPLVMQAVGTIAKTQQMSGGGKSYRFRGIDQVLTKVNAALLAHHCMVSAEVIEHKVERYERDTKIQHHATLRMKVSFIAPDGSKIENIAAGEALDTNSDKASQKAMAGAFKYACFFGLCIPVERGMITDPDAAPKNRRGAPPPAVTDAAEKALRTAPNKGKLKEWLAAAKAKFTEDEYLYLAEVADQREQELNKQPAA